MGYQPLIARTSKKFKWPPWVIYDKNFQQEAAGSTEQQLAKADPSLYAQCITEQDISKEDRCSRCRGLDHHSAATYTHQTHEMPLDCWIGASPRVVGRSSILHEFFVLYGFYTFVNMRRRCQSELLTEITNIESGATKRSSFTAQLEDSRNFKTARSS